MTKAEGVTERGWPEGREGRGGEKGSSRIKEEAVAIRGEEVRVSKK